MPRCGVYCLFTGNKLIYIGKSNNVFLRIHNHTNDKDFDSYSFIVCENSFDASNLEKQMILFYKPPLNIHFRRIQLQTTISHYSRLKDVETWQSKIETWKAELEQIKLL